MEKKTIAQEECKNFEELSESIVRYLFRETKAEIKRTSENKDGGYDIIAEFNDSKETRKVYFECKLRGENLNLRDIAANVIIAFNEGAVALVVFTNYNYTVQLDEQLHRFNKKAILNIKIIIGEEINQIIKKFGISVSPKLLPLIKSKKSNHKVSDTILQLDFSKVSLYQQLLYKNVRQIADTDCFIPASQKEMVVLARNILIQGGIVGVTGFLGIGKNTFIMAVLKELPSVVIYIDAALHTLQENLLLDILLDIWGIPKGDIIEDFTNDDIDSIARKISPRFKNQQTIKILRRLLGDKRINKINDENYNLLICDYIIELLDLHKSNARYIFHIENLEYTLNEISTLLFYLVRRLNKKKISCIIVSNREEYYGQKSINLEESLGYIDYFSLFQLEIYTRKEALEYLHFCKKNISDFIAKIIVDRIGNRQANIDMLLSYLEEAGISLNDYRRILFELEDLSPNSVPALTSKIMRYYRYYYSDFFDILFLLRGKIPESLLPELEIRFELVDLLVDENILSYHSDYYVCANPIVQSIVDDWGSNDKPSIKRLAKKALAILQNHRNLSFDLKAHILNYLGLYEEALDELKKHIFQLEENRLFDALITSYDIAITICENLKCPIKTMFFIIRQIEILIIKKELLSNKATERLNDLAELFKNYSYLNIPQNYFFAFDYFLGKRDFKNGIYGTQQGCGAILKDYYEKTIQGVYKDNNDDWLGKLCCQYALCVKEDKGNYAAMIIFKKAIRALPGSFSIWLEYNSHLACMKLFSAPNESFVFYSKIVDAFNDNKSICALPFHEYIDKAMSKLLEGDNKQAENLAQEAVLICEANGVFDEWGRALNIKGCAILCQGESGESLPLFKESFGLLKTTGYKLYSWRSQLNYVHFSLDKNECNDELINEFKDAYICFLSLSQNKIENLAKGDIEDFFKTREYHALLVLGVCLQKIQKPIINIFKDLKIDKIKERYCKDLQLVLQHSNKVLHNSPYYKSHRIILVG